MIFTPRIGPWKPHEITDGAWCVVHRKTGEFYDVTFEPGGLVTGSVFSSKRWAINLAKQLNEQE